MKGLLMLKPTKIHFCSALAETCEAQDIVRLVLERECEETS